LGLPGSRQTAEYYSGLRLRACLSTRRRNACCPYFLSESLAHLQEPEYAPGVAGTRRLLLLIAKLHANAVAAHAAFPGNLPGLVVAGATGDQIVGAGPAAAVEPTEPHQCRPAITVAGGQRQHH